MYLNRLLYKNNHIPKKSRRGVTRQHLVDLWNQQDGRCAISGLAMTYRAAKGEKFPYNASVDRIVPGAPYEPGNIQLVCAIINSLAKDLPKIDLLQLCVTIAEKYRAQQA